MDEEPLPIRLPGLVLRDGKVTLLDVTTPREYERTWHKYELENYFHARAKLREDPICPHCLKRLPDGKRLYCSKKCRDAEKSKRVRRNYPEKVIRYNERYWSDAKE